MAEFHRQMMGKTAVTVAYGVVADALRQDPEYTEVLTPEQVEALRVPELDQELEQRGLPTKGKAEEKRNRLLEEQATPVQNTTQDEEQD
jgi:hypothetical protein